MGSFSIGLPADNTFASGQSGTLMHVSCRDGRKVDRLSCVLPGQYGVAKVLKAEGHVTRIARNATVDFKSQVGCTQSTTTPSFHSRRKHSSFVPGAHHVLASLCLFAVSRDSMLV